MSDPMLCDSKGNPLQVSATVRLIEGYDDHPDNVGDRVGTVLTLDGPASEYYGFPRVAFRNAGKASHRVPNSALTVVEEFNYEASQLARLSEDESYRLKIVNNSGTGETKWLSVPADKFRRIVAILTEPESVPDENTSTE